MCSIGKGEISGGSLGGAGKPPPKAGFKMSPSKAGNTTAWRIRYHNAGEHGSHWRVTNTRFIEGDLFRAALGEDARAAQEGWLWDRAGL